jgi:hypothetical protein
MFVIDVGKKFSASDIEEISKRGTLFTCLTEPKPEKGVL